MSAEQIIAEYPDLDKDDIKQVLEYAAFLASEEVYPAEIMG